MTDAEFNRVQDKIDALVRSTRRGQQGTPEEIARFNAIYGEWEAAYAMPQIKAVDRKVRDQALTAVAEKYSLL